MAPDNVFKIIEEPETEPSTAEQTGFHLLHLGLKALSQRALVAASALFTLLTVASAFWLFMAIPNPNNTQLIALGMYASFILAVNLIVKR